MFSYKSPDHILSKSDESLAELRSVDLSIFDIFTMYLIFLDVISLCWIYELRHTIYYFCFLHNVNNTTCSKYGVANNRDF